MDYKCEKNILDVYVAPAIEASIDRNSLLNLMLLVANFERFRIFWENNKDVLVMMKLSSKVILCAIDHQTDHNLLIL